VTIATGATGAGVLSFEVRAASCLGDECRLHSRRAAAPVTLSVEGARELTL